MAVSIQSSPQLFTPAWNDIIYTLNSTNKNKEGFKYIVDLYSGDTSILLARLRLPKHPSTGYGVANLKDIISAYVDPSVNLTTQATGFTIASTSYVPVKALFGEQSTYWEFDDNYYFLSGGTGFAGFSSATQKHNFQVGDSVRIIQDAGYSNEEYEGVSTVITIQDQYSIVTSNLWAGNTPAEPGKAAYKNGDFVVVSGLTTGSTFFAYNAAIDHLDFIDYDFSTYYNESAEFSHLTDSPDSIRMRVDQPAWLYLPNSGNSAIYYIKFSAYNESDSLVGEFGIDNPYESGSSQYLHRFLYCPIGPVQLNDYNSSYGTDISGSFPILTSDVTYYLYQLEGQSGEKRTTPKRINIDRRDACYGTKVIVFLDKKGSYFSFPFVLKSTERHKVGRKTYNRPLGKFNGLNWTYESKDRGYKTYSTDVQKEFTVISDWLTVDESEYFIQLVESPDVFEYDPINNRLIPIIIDNGQYEVQRDNSDIIRYQLKYIYSFGVNTQS